eukprot:scaffold2671_cov252-Pinguiococcus_pyrenoidosus.AAC.3
MGSRASMFGFTMPNVASRVSASAPVMYNLVAGRSFLKPVFTIAATERDSAFAFVACAGCSS